MVVVTVLVAVVVTVPVGPVTVVVVSEPGAVEVTVERTVVTMVEVTVVGGTVEVEVVVTGGVGGPLNVKFADAVSSVVPSGAHEALAV